MKRATITLGSLEKEQKEFMWKNTISGSQAWMLINEPYNLLRDKLEQPRIHKSKYDIFKTEQLETVSNHAMKCGTMYEKVVIEEVKEHIPNLSYTDTTYQTHLINDDNSLFSDKITSTPDYIVKENDKVILVGDIKCSTAAGSLKQMTERYGYQALHNCYCLECFDFRLDCKNEITKPLNSYFFHFTQADFDNYEAKLIEFFNAWASGDATYYDSLADTKTNENERNVEPQQVIELTDKDGLFTAFNAYNDLKNEAKEIEAQLKILETQIKELYQDKNLLYKTNLFELSIVNAKRKGGYDTEELIHYVGITYQVPQEMFDRFKKPDTEYLTIKIKPNK